MSELHTASQNNFKVLIEASRKVRAREFTTFKEVQQWILNHPNYTHISKLSEYGCPHLSSIKLFFL